MGEFSFCAFDGLADGLVAGNSDSPAAGAAASDSAGAATLSEVAGVVELVLCVELSALAPQPGTPASKQTTIVQRHFVDSSIARPFGLVVGFFKAFGGLALCQTINLDFVV